MIKVYICPKCGWVRLASRRSTVECFQCSNDQMLPAKLDFVKYSNMSLQERQDYVDSWMYIHGCRQEKK